MDFRHAACRLEMQIDAFMRRSGEAGQFWLVTIGELISAGA